MVYSFTNNKKSSYTFLGMLLLSVFAFEASCYGARNKQSCKKETRPSFLARIKNSEMQCYKCKETSEMFKLWCCKKALCKNCSNTLVFNSLTEILNAEENSEPKFAWYTPCPALCSNFNASTCLNINDFHKLVDNDSELKDLYTRAHELYLLKSRAQNQLNSCDPAPCNVCNKTCRRYQFPNCDHSFCLSQFEKIMIQAVNEESSLAKILNEKAFSFEDLDALDRISCSYNNDARYNVTCSEKDCRGGLTDKLQAEYLTSKSEVILEMQKMLITIMLSFFESPSDILFNLFKEKMNQDAPEQNICETEFNTNLMKTREKLQKDLKLLIYKISVARIFSCEK